MAVVTPEKKTFGSSFSAPVVFLSFIFAVSIYIACMVVVQVNWSSAATMYLYIEHNCDSSSNETYCGNIRKRDIGIDDKEHKLYEVTRLYTARDNSNRNRTNQKTLINTPVIPPNFNPCFLYHKLEKPGLPIVHSMFVDSISQQVVTVGIARNYFVAWNSKTFVCVFMDAGITLITNTDPIIRDFKRFGQEPQYSVVITCPLPQQLLNRTRFLMDFRLASNPSLAYENISVCQAVSERSKKHFLTMCTMTKDMDRYIPNWLDYHRILGVEHVYIYDNSAKSILPRTAAKYIKDGLLTVIPWAHAHSQNKTYLEVQIASENDCIWRHKHTSHWMIKIDVDEFLQPMDYRRPKITDYLKDKKLEQLGSIRIQNWFFCRHNVNYGLKSLQRQRSVFERNLIRHAEPTPINRGRDKAIARPENVHLYKIHGVKLGGDTVTLSPTYEMRMVHYRGDNPRHSHFCAGRKVADFSMIRLWYKLHNANVAELNTHLEKMLTIMKRIGIGYDGPIDFQPKIVKNPSTYANKKTQTNLPGVNTSLQRIPNVKQIQVNVTSVKQTLKPINVVSVEKNIFRNLTSEKDYLLRNSTSESEYLLGNSTNVVGNTKNVSAATIA